MGDVGICSLNCRGLGDYKKRRDVLNLLRGTHFNIFLLQYLHCHPSREHRFRNRPGSELLMAGYTHNAKGVAILTKAIVIEMSETKRNEGGNFIINRAKTNKDFKVILGNIYGPNTDEPSFYEEVTNFCISLKGDQDIPVVIAGDFNIAINFEVDTVNYAKLNNPMSHKSLEQIISSLKLYDVFRYRNSDNKKFTWKVVCTARKLARLDYFLVSEALDSQVVDSKIISGYRSHHSAVTLNLRLCTQKRGKRYYKMNTPLLKDTEYVTK